MTSMLYRARFIHPAGGEYRSTYPGTRLDANGTMLVSIRDGAFSNSLTLAKALRDAEVIASGSRVREFRVEGERTIVFPTRTPWHAVILTPEG